MQDDSNTKKVNLSLIGESGKMGRALKELIFADPELALSRDPDVVIDFSSPEGTLKAIALGKPLVSGTTALPRETLIQLEELSKIVPVVHSPNFSIGIAICFEILEQYKEMLKKYSTISIEEVHHLEKKDAPSGTALKLGSLLDCNAIESTREGQAVGMHQINFSLEGETLSLRHEAHSRHCFAHGALTVAKKIANLPPKLYTLKDVLLSREIRC